jgi:hypothetical protein
LYIFFPVVSSASKKGKSWPVLIFVLIISGIGTNGSWE